jgi:hypothetical protein
VRNPLFTILRLILSMTLVMLLAPGLASAQQRSGDILKSLERGAEPPKEPAPKPPTIEQEEEKEKKTEEPLAPSRKILVNPSS